MDIEGTVGILSDPAHLAQLNFDSLQSNIALKTDKVKWDDLGYQKLDMINSTGTIFIKF